MLLPIYNIYSDLDDMFVELNMNGNIDLWLDSFCTCLALNDTLNDNCVSLARSSTFTGWEARQ